MLRFLIVIMLLPPTSGDLLESVNSERGGRHWISQKPAPAKSPEESRACFQIEPGSRIELVAAEPLVFDPVWIDFDHLGRMFAAEYGDYPIGPVNKDGTANPNAQPLSKIVLLEDTDNDGRMDKRTVFADDLNFCHSFMPLMNGILACAQTEILFLKDTDGDNVADHREVWFDGFTPAHPQMQIGCPRFGNDNWIYLTYAPGNVLCRRPGFETKERVKMPRQDMRFHPVTMQFEVVSGMGQFGNTINNDGHRFFSTNRNPIMMEIFPQSAASRNPFASISKRHADVGPSGGDTRVFPLVDMKSNWLAHAGTHTSACGVTAYRGNLWDSEFRRSVFACEPVGHVVTRSIVERQADSPVLSARRARAKADFLASSDTWFRPSSMRTGPDGGLYLADMYRMWVEHPKFLPPEIAAQIDWRAGEQKGRIWRIVPDDFVAKGRYEAPVKADGSVDPTALMKLLQDTNGSRRQTAHRLLLEQAADALQGLPKTPDAEHFIKFVAEEATKLLKRAGVHPQIRQHALYVLEACHGLEDEDIIACWRAAESARETKNDDSDSALLVTLAKLMAVRVNESSTLSTEYPAFVSNDDLAVAIAAILALPDNTPAKAIGDWLSVAAEKAGHWNDPWFQKAVQAISGKDPFHVIDILIRRSATDAQAGANHEDLLTEASRQTAVQGDPMAVGRFLMAMRDQTTSPADAVAMALGFNSGSRKNSGTLKYRSLNSLLTSPGDVLLDAQHASQSPTDVANDVRNRIEQIVTMAKGTTATPQQRVTGLKLLAIIDRKELVEELPELLSSTRPAAEQVSAIEIVREFNIPEGIPVVLTKMASLAPAARAEAVSLFLMRTASTATLLATMQEGKIPSGIIPIDQRVRLLQHKDEEIKKLASAVFGGVVSSNRKAVADEYQPALTMAASAERGRLVFNKTCVKCHKIDGQGHNVGPDISDTRRRSRDALLYDILDPNRRIDPQFSEYVVLTNDGLTYNGLLVSDSGAQIILRQPEGKERTIDRSDIDEMKATGKSLMPEGIEKDVSIQEMADLLELLKTR